MKNIGFWALFLLFPVLLAAQETPSLHPDGVTNKLPGFKTVVEQFFLKYTAPEPSSYYLRFELRPDGWYAAHLDDDQMPTGRELFYDPKKQKFLPLHTFNTSSGSSIEAKIYLNAKSYDIAEFSREPYFGYEGWYKDVIARYENRPDLSAWELQALARAYQTAQAALVGNGSYPDPADRLELPYGPNAFSAQHKKRYLEINALELATYRRLIALDPNFMTPVGPITTKYANEVMDLFLNLLIYQNEPAAREVLQPDLYDAYLLECARNLLNSCPPDAVLFTWGDSDTYPLLNVQAMENFRTDVVVTNLSLLVTPRYNAMIRSGPMGAKPLKTLLPEAFFQHIMYIFHGDSWRYVYLGEQQSFTELLDFVRDTTNFELKAGILNGSAEPTQIGIPVPANAPVLGHTGRPDTIYFQADRFLLSDGLSQMDLLAANNWQRPLCYTLTCSINALKPWEPHLALEGLVYRLYPDTLEQVESMGEGYVNTEEGYRIWNTVLRFDADGVITENDKLPFYQSNWLAGYKLAEALHEKGQDERALNILDILEREYPNGSILWNYSWVYAVELWGACGKPGKGEQVAYLILDNYEGTELAEHVQEKKQVLERLMTYSEKYDLKNLKSRCKKMLK